ncbi:hypothetical protein vBBceHLY2_00038 [Bacillus phage vB_BceH_LY2]|nr:hypothetical protein vBBceHLY2_00038 [Bacillus phage vB_BceH_LY2]
MRELYFEVSNGECIEPYTVLSVYRAILEHNKIIRIETCFNISNIIKHGYDWFQEQVKEENGFWSGNCPHLNKSLQKLVNTVVLTRPFEHTNFYMVNHRFPYILVWHHKKDYKENYFQ